MGKFFVILIVLVFGFVGYLFYYDNHSVVPDITVKEFVYHGHSYLLFKNSSSYGSTVLHNPDCKKCATLQYK